MAKIATKLTKWEPLRPFLKLTRPQEETIRRNYHTYERQKMKLLEKWKMSKGNEATYGALITAAEMVADDRLAAELKKMIREDVPS